jgi:Uma2 family endonuclease
VTAVDSPRPLFSRDEFRVMEANAAHDVRLERMDGYVYAMAGAGLAHERVVARALVALDDAARRQGCEVLGSNRRLSIGTDSDFLPDVAVYCDSTDDEYAGTRPCLVVEVLSRSTAIDDLNLKVPRYKSIPSVEAILLINPEPLYAELHVLSGDEWEQHRITEPDVVFELPCPAIAVTLGQFSP